MKLPPELPGVPLGTRHFRNDSLAGAWAFVVYSISR